MLDETTLNELKSKLPSRYANLVIKSYLELHGKVISRWTINRFFKGQTYSEELHNAILNVVSAQQLLRVKTQEALHG